MSETKTDIINFDHIRIIIVDKEKKHPDFFYYILMSAKMEGMKQAYAKHVGRKVRKTEFKFNDKTIKNDATPLSLGLKTMDQIIATDVDAYLHNLRYAPYAKKRKIVKIEELPIFQIIDPVVYHNHD